MPGMVGQQPGAMFNPQQQQQQQQQPGNPQQQMQQQKQRDVIWEGELHWKENTKSTGDGGATAGGGGGEKHEYSIRCSVTSTKDNGGVREVRSDNWPRRLIMQLIPKTLLQTIGGSFFKDSKSVLFHPEQSDALDVLTRVFGTGHAGCVHFAGAQNCDIKVGNGSPVRYKGSFTLCDETM